MNGKKTNERFFGLFVSSLLYLNKWAVDPVDSVSSTVTPVLEEYDPVGGRGRRRGGTH